MEGVRGGATDPGEYRKIQNFVVNSTTGETVYTPPPSHNVPILMVGLVDWLNQKKEIHPVLVSGISQFQFVHVHPMSLPGRIRFQATFHDQRVYYDRDRSAFYRAIQSVRDNSTDFTGWLEYFAEGLTTQLTEVKARGEQVTRKDVLVKEHRLSDRQAKALGHILEHGNITIHEFEGLCPRSTAVLYNVTSKRWWIEAWSSLRVKPTICSTSWRKGVDLCDKFATH